MSDNGSSDSNDDHVHVDNPEIEQPTSESLETKTPKLESKLSTSGNFGRPRKHPYKPGKYKCEYCDVMCSKPSVLKKHLRAHTNERPYPCNICKRSFKTKSNLSKHMKSKSHSSKVQPSNKEKASLMLNVLSGLDSDSFKNNNNSAALMDNIEYDCVEKNVATDNSPDESCDDRSVASEDDSIVDSPKRVTVSEHSHDTKDDTPDNEVSSCSGMLTINSECGPITVEVEIKMETMKQLQHGLTNMAFKKSTPSPSSASLPLRNDADVRAAESILHMANQRHADLNATNTDNRASPVCLESKLMVPKIEENRRSDSIESTESAYPTNKTFPEVPQILSKPTKPTSLTFNPKPLSRGRTASKLIPNEDQKKMKKCIQESLLKRMQRKTDKSTKQTEFVSKASNQIYYNNSSVTEIEPDSTQNNPASTNQNPTPTKKPINANSSYKPSTLISESKMPSTNVSGNSNTPKQTMVIHRAMPPIVNSSNSPTQVPANPTLYLLSPFQDHTIPSMRPYSPISSPGFKVDSTTDNLPRGFNNFQRIYQPTKPWNISNQTLISSPNSVPPPVLHSIKEESIIQQRDRSMSPANVLSVDISENQSLPQQSSVTTSTQVSEAGSSPRLCIVEDTTDLVPVQEVISDNKKTPESDEEIDVVNTDSDDNDASVKRISGRGSSLSVHKKRKGARDYENDSLESDSKRLKEMEKPLTLHAPNINAKDLVQDCPLNLSANRQPIIPSCATTESVLEKIYRPKTTSNSDSHIAALTNTNPAHPHSLREPLSSSSLASSLSSSSAAIDVSSMTASNGHHLADYPIFEDKVHCEVCSQMIEPSRLQLHTSMHIFTDSKDQQSPASNSSASEAASSKQAFNKPRTYRCVVCNTGFRVIGHLSKHHKSKSHLQGLVNSGLLSKALNAKIEENKVPIAEVIDQKTGNIIPEVLSKYISDWSQPTIDSDS